jgi:hypothetical protein
MSKALADVPEYGAPNFAAMGLIVLGIVAEWRIQERDNRILSKLALQLSSESTE